MVPRPLGKHSFSRSFSRPTRQPRLGQIRPTRDSSRSRMRINLHVAAALVICVFCRECAGWQAPAGTVRSHSRGLEPKTRWCAARTALQNRNDVADDTQPPAWPPLWLSKPRVEVGDAPMQVAAVAKKISGAAEKFFIRFGSAFHYEYDLDAGSPGLQNQLSIRKESSAQRVLRWLTTPEALENAGAEHGPHETEIPLAKLNAVSANRKQWSTGVAVAKLNARAANKEQWGIDADAAALGLGAGAPNVPRESQRIGSIGFAGTAAESISARRDGGRRIGSIKPAWTANDSALSRPVSEDRASSKANVLPLAKLNARAANKEQWGIDADAAALGLGAGAPNVPRESQRIGSIGFAGTAAESISARRDGGRRIGSIKPAWTANDLAQPVAEARFDDDALTSSSLLGLPTPAVEMYAGGAPLDQKAAALSRAKRAAFTENLRRCARDPAINLGLGQEWDTLESGKRAK